MKYYSKIELVILDDFLLHTVSDQREIKVPFEIMEKCSELQVSTIVMLTVRTKELEINDSQ